MTPTARPGRPLRKEGRPVGPQWSFPSAGDTQGREPEPLIDVQRLAAVATVDPAEMFLVTPGLLNSKGQEADTRDDLVI